jgi:hypothetical protein
MMHRTMDRLFTCFVSSTFLDLREERQRLARVLLRNECVPLGMETFPSVGKGQWSLIEDSIQAADFCIFMVGGRYGSISDQPPLSWTHREFRRAVELGKPIAALLHAAPETLSLERSEAAPDARLLLTEFRQELEEHTVCEYWRNEADLVEAASSSIRAFREGGALVGWARASEPVVLVEEADFDRVYDLLELDYAFFVSAERPDTIDGFYKARRRLTCNAVDGLGYVALDFSRGNERQLPFDERTEPRLELTSLQRSSNGGGALDGRPRKRQGSTFIQDVVFRPPLAAGETVDFEVSGRLPSYKYRYRDQILEATADARGGARTYEWTSRQISFPTRELVIRVFLAEDTGAVPFGPSVGRGAITEDRRLSAALQTSDAYTVDLNAERQGVKGIEMRLTIQNPSLLRRYRLAWELPMRP